MRDDDDDDTCVDNIYFIVVDLKVERLFFHGANFTCSI